MYSNDNSGNFNEHSDNNKIKDLSFESFQPLDTSYDGSSFGAIPTIKRNKKLRNKQRQERMDALEASFAADEKQEPQTPKRINSAGVVMDEKDLSERNLRLYFMPIAGVGFGALTGLCVNALLGSVSAVVVVGAVFCGVSALGAFSLFVNQLREEYKVYQLGSLQSRIVTIAVDARADESGHVPESVILAMEQERIDNPTKLEATAMLNEARIGNNRWKTSSVEMAKILRVLGKDAPQIVPDAEKQGEWVLANSLEAMARINGHDSNKPKIIIPALPSIATPSPTSSSPWEADTAETMNKGLPDFTNLAPFPLDLPLVHPETGDLLTRFYDNKGNVDFLYKMAALNPFGPNCYFIYKLAKKEVFLVDDGEVFIAINNVMHQLRNEDGSPCVLSESPMRKKHVNPSQEELDEKYNEALPQLPRLSFADLDGFKLPPPSPEAQAVTSPERIANISPLNTARRKLSEVPSSAQYKEAQSNFEQTTAEAENKINNKPGIPAPSPPQIRYEQSVKEADENHLLATLPIIEPIAPPVSPVSADSAASTTSFDSHSPETYHPNPDYISPSNSPTILSQFRQGVFGARTPSPEAKTGVTNTEAPVKYAQPGERDSLSDDGGENNPFVIKINTGSGSP